MLAKFAFKLVKASKHWKTNVSDDGQIHYAGNFVSWPQLADELQGGGGTGWVDEMKMTKFLFIDDIGQVLDKTGFITSKLSSLLAQRVGKWTFLTTNLTVQQISEKLDTRIASRLIRDGSQVVEVDTEDWNLR